MKSSLFSTLLVSALLATLLPAGVGAVPADNNLSFDRNEYSIKVTGNQNVPKYTFTSAITPNATFKIMYQKIYESSASKKVENSISLPSLKWLIAPDADDKNVFWINNTGANGNNILPWTTLAFKNTLFNDTVKFDVILNGYKWGSETSTSLNFAWKFSASGNATEDSEAPVDGNPGLAPTTAEPTAVCFGTDGVMCFDIAETANVTDPDNNNQSTEIKVGLAFDGTEGVTVSYERFKGNLYHDPTFGFTNNDATECEGLLGAIMCFVGSIFFCFS